MSGMHVIVGCLCVCVSIALALIVSLHRKLDSRLRVLPQAVWKAMKVDHEQSGVNAFDAAKVAALVTGIREYHEALAAILRTEREDAALRAHLAMRDWSDTKTVVETGVELVREARAMVDRLRPSSTELAQIAAGLGRRPPHAPPKKVERELLLPPPAEKAGDRSSEEEEEEMTMVASRPASAEKTLSSMTAVPPETKRGVP